MEAIDISVEAGDEPVRYDAQAVSTLADQLIAAGGWLRGGTLNLEGGIRWRPHLVSDDGKKIAHMHFADELRSYVVERIHLAHAAGLVIHVVLPLAALYDTEVLEMLAEADAHVHIADVPLPISEHHLDAISKARVPLSPEARKLVALATWKRMREGTNSEKGKRLERLLAFLLDQTLGLKVAERNYRGDTDEIDLVVQIVRYTTACWFQEGVPFMLVEAKNRSEATSQHMVSNLIRRLQTKRGTARIGLLFTTSHFTQDSKLEVIKIAEGTVTVVLVKPEEIANWIDAVDPDVYLEDLVRRAMLR